MHFDNKKQKLFKVNVLKEIENSAIEIFDPVGKNILLVFDADRIFKKALRSRSDIVYLQLLLICG